MQACYRGIVVFAVAAVPCFAKSGRAELFLDRFKTFHSLEITSSRDQAVTSIMQDSEVLGSYRRMGLIQQGAGASSLEVFMQLIPEKPPASYLNFAADAGTLARFSLEYDGDNKEEFTPSGLGGIDLTQGGSLLGLRAVLASDQSSVLKFELWDTSGGYSTADLPILDTGVSYRDHFLPFADLSGNANVAKAGALRISVGTSDNIAADMLIESFSFAAPEPAAPILALCTACLFGLRKRRAKAAQ